jgi:hypothetical protein
MRGGCDAVASGGRNAGSGRGSRLGTGGPARTWFSERCGDLEPVELPGCPERAHQAVESFLMLLEHRDGVAVCLGEHPLDLLVDHLRSPQARPRARAA